MGLDLSVMPIQYGNVKTNKWWLCYNRLSFDRNYDLFEFFGSEREEHNKKTIKEKKIPDDVSVDIYGDEGLKKEVNNPYGEPLTFFYAEDVKNIPIKKSFSDWNKAIIKFLKSLPPKTVVVLMWR